MGKRRKQRDRHARHYAIIRVEVLHPAIPSDFRLVVPANATDDVIQREISETLGAQPDTSDGLWRWRCVSPDGPVKTRLMTRPTRRPFLGEA